MAKGTCVGTDCDREALYRGYCNAHYKRLRRTGELANVRHRQVGPCTVDGCDRPSARRGWCDFHSQRWYRTGSVDAPPQRETPTCSIDECSGEVIGRGYCSKHYWRFRRYGDTDYARRAEPGSGTVTANGYLVIQCHGHPVARKHGNALAHRVALYDAIGSGPHPCHWCGVTLIWNENLTVDHLDWNRLNNDPANLVPSCNPCNSARQEAHQMTDPNAAADTR